MFDINSKIMKMANKYGFDDMVIISRDYERRQVRFANGDISIVKHWSDRTTDLFIAKSKRIVSTSISNYDDAHIELVLKNIEKLISTLEPKEDYSGIAAGPFNYENIEKTYDPKILEVDPAEPVMAAINASPFKRSAGVLYVDHPKIYLTTSGDVEAMDEGTGIELSIRVFKDDLASGHATISSRTLADFKPEWAAEKAGDIAKMIDAPITGDAGKYDVIFDPLSIGNLLSMVGQFTSAMAVEAGFSFLMNKIGEKVADEQFNFRDAGNLPNGYNTRKFDDEGVPTKTTNIIENGVLKTYLLNTSYAKKYGMENTANAGLIMPRPWNLYVQPGDFEDVEIFDIQHGLYVTNIWYTRFQNYVKGDFSTIPRDGIFLIEHGEIKKAVKNIRISDNIQRMLMNIDALGKHVHQIHWWEAETPVFTPYIRIRNVGITRATQ